ncbi:uncharacterized protein DUF4191 [Sediminihabitans luteus]|uniref:Uncharacterized protein DUF4191 n=1 Tax=Sediminihabitans luteus TaxID=1138585 RepID=A0A2M9CQ06_9CELL|nr:DUF4191 domain-containing protein [Sediminihabitans luteus]PJJ74010.1 uncharacterized protein DUF4191 [Sediminihabitans luteus]GII98075.1 hypothetical protein Slu03_04530 [Sediminihabitans luteus]
MARKNTDTSASQDAKPKKVKKQRWYHQVWSAYQMTRKRDPMVTWVMLGVFAAIMVIAVGIGLAWGHPIYMTIVGLPFSLLGAMFILTRRAERAAYGQIEGQSGASRAALGTIRRGWSFDDEPVAFDPRTKDAVFRGVGRAGVVLVTEGPSTRVKRLTTSEKKRINRVLPNVPVTVVECGNDEGQVPLMKIARTVQKLKPTLTKAELGEVNKRLRALGGAKLPIPKGVDPMRARPDRKGMKGR